jgi:hypothetical protein
MWAVYLCGATDCFLHALFRDHEAALEWAANNSTNPEGYSIRYWASIADIDKTDTGWEDSL